MNTVNLTHQTTTQSTRVHGPCKINGAIKIAGSKNAALPILAASILSSQQPCVLSNIPQLTDTQHILNALMSLGTHVCLTDQDQLAVTPPSQSFTTLNQAITKNTRASILFLGPLLTKYKKANIALPGGCNIGQRPIDQHINGLEKMGASITITDGVVNATAPNGLTGCHIVMPSPASVGGTENIMMAACLAKGTTTITNPAMEPEVEDLIGFLVSMGAKIQYNNNDQLVIEGQERLIGTHYHIISDRIEAGTYLIAAAATQGSIQIKNCNPEHLSTLIHALQQSGHHILTKDQSVYLRAGTHTRAIDINTAPYPGFPTDLQPQWTSLACVSQGVTMVRESLFENRFQHIPELVKMGARIIHKSNREISITGNRNLKGIPVQVTDLRAGAALLIAGMCAKGTTTLVHSQYLDRGYLHLQEKLAQLGLTIE
ncbi:MAG: UDP-N-acetylglucosamine 1-carboxyvinyltransferase [Pseudomonadota bacterium]|nr:UDP-N-acetylglucosamine 1-carboxyvinyltransferase [Pseudomonadota bacterium]